MAVLMFVFMICATRTNLVYTLIFLSLLIVFLMLSSAYWTLGVGNASTGNKCVVVSSLESCYFWKFETLTLFYEGCWSVTLRCKLTRLLPSHSSAF